MHHHADNRNIKNKINFPYYYRCGFKSRDTQVHNHVTSHVPQFGNLCYTFNKRITYIHYHHTSCYTDAPTFSYIKSTRSRIINCFIAITYIILYTTRHTECIARIENTHTNYMMKGEMVKPSLPTTTQYIINRAGILMP